MPVLPGDMVLFSYNFDNQPQEPAGAPAPGEIRLTSDQRECLMQFIRRTDRTEWVHAAIVGKVDDDGIHLINMEFTGVRRRTVAQLETNVYGDNTAAFFRHLEMTESQRAQVENEYEALPAGGGAGHDIGYAFGDLILKALLNQHRDGIVPAAGPQLAVLFDQTGLRMCGGYVRTRLREMGLDLGEPVVRQPGDQALDHECWDALAGLLDLSLVAALDDLAANVARGEPAAVTAKIKLVRLAALTLRLTIGGFDNDPVEARRALVAALARLPGDDAADLPSLPGEFVERANALLDGIDGDLPADRFYTAGDFGAAVANGSLVQVDPNE